MQTKFDLVDILILIGVVALVTQIALMTAVWVETRRVRKLLHEFLQSNRENSRSLMAAIHEAGCVVDPLAEVRIPVRQDPIPRRGRLTCLRTQRLAEKGKLFLALTHILKASGYATVVILVGQAEKLVGNRALTDMLMNIYDPQGTSGLDVFFVFTGPSDMGPCLNPSRGMPS